MKLLAVGNSFSQDASHFSGLPQTYKPYLAKITTSHQMQ